MAKRGNRARKRVTTTTTKDTFKGVEAQQKLASGKLYQWREKDRPRLLNAVEMPSYMQEALNFCASNPFVGLDDIAHNGLVTHTVETTERIIFSKMTDEQLKQVLPFLNKRCFKNPLTLEQLKDLFQYKINHVQVKQRKSIATLAYLFDALKEKGLIADGWKTTVQEKEMFLNTKGLPLKQRYISRMESDFNEKIKDYFFSLEFHHGNETYFCEENDTKDKIKDLVEEL